MPGVTLSLLDSDGLCIKQYASVDGPVDIGRGSRNDPAKCSDKRTGMIRVPGCSVMSSKQAKVTWHKHKFAMIEDAGSANGTYLLKLGEHRLRKLEPHTRYKLTNGAQVTFGHSVLRDDGTICSPLTLTVRMSTDASRAHSAPAPAAAATSSSVGPTSAQSKQPANKPRSECSYQSTLTLISDKTGRELDLADRVPHALSSSHAPERRRGFGLSEQDLIDLETTEDDDDNVDGERQVKKQTAGIDEMKQVEQLMKASDDRYFNLPGHGFFDHLPSQDPLRERAGFTSEWLFAAAHEAISFASAPSASCRLPSPESPKSKGKDTSACADAPEKVLDRKTTASSAGKALFPNIDANVQKLPTDDAASQGSHLPSPSETVLEEDSLRELGPFAAKGATTEYEDRSDSDEDDEDEDLDEDEQVSDGKEQDVDAVEQGFDGADQDVDEADSVVDEMEQDEMEQDVSDDEHDLDEDEQDVDEEDEQDVDEEDEQELEEMVQDSEDEEQALSEEEDFDNEVEQDLSENEHFASSVADDDVSDKEQDDDDEDEDEEEEEEEGEAYDMRQDVDSEDERASNAGSGNEALLDLGDEAECVVITSVQEQQGQPRNIEIHPHPQREIGSSTTTAHMAERVMNLADRIALMDETFDACEAYLAHPTVADVVRRSAGIQAVLDSDAHEDDKEILEKSSLDHVEADMNDHDSSRHLIDALKQSQEGESDPKGLPLLQEAVAQVDATVASPGELIGKKRTFDDGPGEFDQVETVAVVSMSGAKRDTLELVGCEVDPGSKYSTDATRLDRAQDEQEQSNKRRRVSEHGRHLLSDVLKISAGFVVGVVGAFIGLDAIGSFYGDV
ncbi:hypothetical protein ACM66B_000907 [Microbotryomycetes sp. NB124-2]